MVSDEMNLNFILCHAAVIWTSLEVAGRVKLDPGFSCVSVRAKFMSETIQNRIRTSHPSAGYSGYAFLSSGRTVSRAGGTARPQLFG